MDQHFSLEFHAPCEVSVTKVLKLDICLMFFTFASKRWIQSEIHKHFSKKQTAEKIHQLSFLQSPPNFQ